MSNINKKPIPHRVYNPSKEHPYVAGAVDIIDDRLSQNQQAVNEDTYRKDETYSKEQLNNLITTPEQQYVTVTADDQTVDVTDILPATGEADTVYRVGNWDGEQYDDSCYSEYAWDGTQYQFLSKKQPGIDDGIIAGSDNLAKSGATFVGIKNESGELKKSLFGSTVLQASARSGYYNLTLCVFAEGNYHGIIDVSKVKGLHLSAETDGSVSQWAFFVDYDDEKCVLASERHDEPFGRNVEVPENANYLYLYLGSVYSEIDIPDISIDEGMSTGELQNHIHDVECGVTNLVHGILYLSEMAWYFYETDKEKYNHLIIPITPGDTIEISKGTSNICCRYLRDYNLPQAPHEYHNGIAVYRANNIVSIYEDSSMWDVSSYNGVAPDDAKYLYVLVNLNTTGNYYMPSSIKVNGDYVNSLLNTNHRITELSEDVTSIKNTYSFSNTDLFHNVKEIYIDGEDVDLSGVASIRLAIAFLVGPTYYNVLSLLDSEGTVLVGFSKDYTSSESANNAVKDGILDCTSFYENSLNVTRIVVAGGLIGIGNNYYTGSFGDLCKDLNMSPIINDYINKVTKTANNLKDSLSFSNTELFTKIKEIYIGGDNNLDLSSVVKVRIYACLNVSGTYYTGISLIDANDDVIVGASYDYSSETAANEAVQGGIISFNNFYTNDLDVDKIVIAGNLLGYGSHYFDGTFNDFVKSLTLNPIIGNYLKGTSNSVGIYKVSANDFYLLKRQAGKTLKYHWSRRYWTSMYNDVVVTDEDCWTNYSIYDANNPGVELAQTNINFIHMFANGPELHTGNGHGCTVDKVFEMFIDGKRIDYATMENGSVLEGDDIHIIQQSEGYYPSLERTTEYGGDGNKVYARVDSEGNPVLAVMWCLDYHFRYDAEEYINKLHIVNDNTSFRRCYGAMNCIFPASNSHHVSVNDSKATLNSYVRENNAWTVTVENGENLSLAETNQLHCATKVVQYGDNFRVETECINDSNPTFGRVYPWFDRTFAGGRVKMYLTPINVTDAEGSTPADVFNAGDVISCHIIRNVSIN